jgi:hypothetical protein
MHSKYKSQSARSGLGGKIPADWGMPRGSKRSVTAASSPNVSKRMAIVLRIGIVLL